MILNNFFLPIFKTSSWLDWFRIKLKSFIWLSLTLIPPPSISLFASDFDGTNLWVIRASRILISSLFLKTISSKSSWDFFSNIETALFSASWAEFSEWQSAVTKYARRFFALLISFDIRSLISVCSRSLKINNSFSTSLSSTFLQYC